MSAASSSSQLPSNGSTAVALVAGRLQQSRDTQQQALKVVREMMRGKDVLKVFFKCIPIY
jgi:hypothetical protein